MNEYQAKISLKISSRQAAVAEIKSLNKRLEGEMNNNKLLQDSMKSLESTLLQQGARNETYSQRMKKKTRLTHWRATRRTKLTNPQSRI